MTLKIVLVLIVALATIAVPYYFFNDRSVNHGAQLETETAGRRDAEMQQCLARVELDYVEDVKQEYISSPFKTPSPIGLTQEIRDRIERKKNSGVADCHKVYGPNTSSAPSP